MGCYGRVRGEFKARGGSTGLEEVVVDDRGSHFAPLEILYILFIYTLPIGPWRKTREGIYSGERGTS